MSSATLAGVKPTRNSLSLVSFGAPINILCHPKDIAGRAFSVIQGWLCSRAKQSEATNEHR
jgi:hypothetical protein